MDSNTQPDTGAQFAQAIKKISELQETTKAQGTRIDELVAESNRRHERISMLRLLIGDACNVLSDAVPRIGAKKVKDGLDLARRLQDCLERLNKAG